MRRIFISVLLALGAAVNVHAQDLAAVELQADRLRAQLLEVTGREEQLRQRARRLEEDLEPQNVERSVAGVGTTDARAIRDQRRQQLEREKAQVDSQLASLAESRYRLEAAIYAAEAEAVRLRAARVSADNAGGRAEPTPMPAAPITAPAVRRGNAPVRKSRIRKRTRPRRRS